jgi:hypothetical protein
MGNTNHTMSDLELFQDFLESAEGKRLFTNKHSGDWFIRTYRHDLVKAGVLVKLLGRFHIIKPNFVPTLIEILQQRTRQSAAKAENEL